MHGGEINIQNSIRGKDDHIRMNSAQDKLGNEWQRNSKWGNPEVHKKRKIVVTTEETKDKDADDSD